MKSRLAIVTPWFGPQLRGGAEQQSWELSHHLAEAGHRVDVLTTCCPSANDDWSSNALPAGVEQVGNVTVKRFRVDRRDGRAFNRVNAQLVGADAASLRPSLSPLSDEDARTFEVDNINSRPMLEYLEREGRHYKAVVFIPYLYGTTIAGLPLVAERAYLQPCLHDEPYAFLPVVRRAAHAARGILFNSEGEYDIAREIFGPGIVKKSIVVGQGVEDERASPAERIAQFVPSKERYVLFLGRQDPRKNVSLLVHAFREFKRRYPMSRLKLVLAGGRSTSFADPGKAIFDFGVIDERQKAALLGNALALAQPSIMESYSRVMMESWMHGRPVIVHEDCYPTSASVRACAGGFLAGTAASWESVLYEVDVADAAALAEMGERGRAYALHHSSWPKVIERYEHALGLDGSAAPRPPVEAVHQVLDAAPGLAHHYADALSRTLRRLRVKSLAGESAFEEQSPLIVHDAPGVEPDAYAAAAALVHHSGGAGAHKARQFDLVFGSSPKALEELRAAGAAAPAFLPVCVDPRDWDCDDDRALARALSDGCDNLIYVGPFERREPLDELLTAFLHYLTHQRSARLVLVARGAVDEEIYQDVAAKVRALNLVDRALLARDVTGPQLQSVFRCASLFWCLDEEESLGEGFLQALWFDVPILAFKTPLSEAFVGEGGILLRDKSDLLAVAAFADMMVHDASLRAGVVSGQRRLRERFDGEAIARDLLERLAAAQPALTAHQAAG